MATISVRRRRSAAPRYPTASGLSEAPVAQQRSIPTRCSPPQDRKARRAGIACHRGRSTWLRPRRMTKQRNCYNDYYRLREKQQARSSKIENGWTCKPVRLERRASRLDLVNTLDERPSGAPVENLATYGDLVRFAELAGLIK